MNEPQYNYIYVQEDIFAHCIRWKRQADYKNIHLKFTSAVPFAKLALLDRINQYLYCAVLYQWKIPVFIVIFMQSLVYIICIVSIEYDPH